MKLKSLSLILTFAFISFVSSGSSYTWTTPPPSAPLAGLVSMSADGGTVCVCQPGLSIPFVSRDRGQTWFATTNAPWGGGYPYSPFAVSADGSQIVACLRSNGGSGYAVYRSSDFGTNWTQLALPVAPVSLFYTVASSASGSNLIAAEYIGPIYFSTNSGANWSTSSAPITNWFAVASSASGERMVAAANPGNIYFSTNFGADWTPITGPPQYLYSVCMSADGQFIGGAGYTNTFITQNAGASWITNNLGDGNQIACSADGQTWMLAADHVYTSSDGGVTWSTNLLKTEWDAAMSADGCEIFADTINNAYTLRNAVGRITPQPQLNLQSQDPNVTVSWLIPSTNFVLQQTADLSNPTWTTVSTSPALNLTNLNQQVSLPGNGSNAFFRLSAQ